MDVAYPLVGVLGAHDGHKALYATHHRQRDSTHGICGSRVVALPHRIERLQHKGGAKPPPYKLSSNE